MDKEERSQCERGSAMVAKVNSGTHGTEVRIECCK